MNKNIKKYAFRKGNKVAAKGKGVMKRKTIIKNMIQKSIDCNRKNGIKTISDFDEVLFDKIMRGLNSKSIQISSQIAISMLQYRFAKKKELDLGENAQKILEVHRPTEELFKRN